MTSSSEHALTAQIYTTRLFKINDSHLKLCLCFITHLNLSLNKKKKKKNPFHSFYLLLVPPKPEAVLVPEEEEGVVV